MRPLTYKRAAGLAILLWATWFDAPNLYPQQIIQGRVRYEEGSLENLDGIKVALGSNSMGGSVSVETNAKGDFKIKSDVAMPDPFLLYYKPGFISQIVPVKSGQKSFETTLRITEFLPKEQPVKERITLCGNVLKDVPGEGPVPVPLVSIYANNGLQKAISNKEGYFQIEMLPENNGSSAYLWLEKERYKTLIYHVANAREHGPSNKLMIKLTPVSNYYDFNFNVWRSDRKNEPIENVTVKIDDRSIGATDSLGTISTSLPLLSNSTTSKVSFHHPFFSPQTVNIPLGSFIISWTVQLDPLPYNINSIVYYYMQQRAYQGIDGVIFKLGDKEIGATDAAGKCNLNFRAVPGDTIRVLLPKNKRFVPEDTTLIFSRGQRNINLEIARKPLYISIKPNAAESHALNDIEVQFFQSGQGIHTEKVRGEGFTITSNIVDPESRLDAYISSDQYELVDHHIAIKTDDSSDKYSGTLNIRKKQAQQPKFAEPSETTSLKGILKIKTNPDNVRVIADSSPPKETVTKNNVAEMQVNAGHNTIWLKKENYISFPLNLEIPPGDTVYRKITLEGPILPLQRLTKTKIAIEAGVLGWYLGKDFQLFPTAKFGGHLYWQFSRHVGFNFSYLASKVPSFYLDQEFVGGFYAGSGRFHTLVHVKLISFEASKKILAKFDGESAEAKFWISLGSANTDRDSLIFLNQYSHALGLGYETALGSINKSVDGNFPIERELFLGYQRRWKHGIIEFRLGQLLDPVTVIKENTRVRADLHISRLYVRYLYFLN